MLCVMRVWHYFKLLYDIGVDCLISEFLNRSHLDMAHFSVSGSGIYWGGLIRKKQPPCQGGKQNRVPL
jgi:hypothetical protein